MPCPVSGRVDEWRQQPCLAAAKTMPRDPDGTQDERQCQPLVGTALLILATRFERFRHLTGRAIARLRRGPRPSLLCSHSRRVARNTDYCISTRNSPTKETTGSTRGSSTRGVNVAYCFGPTTTIVLLDSVCEAPWTSFHDVGRNSSPVMQRHGFHARLGLRATVATILHRSA
jgi:hypothetical protein